MRESLSALFFFWIAEFSDGTALSQFDPNTGKENKGDPEWLSSEKNEEVSVTQRENFAKKKVVRFGWYPFTFDFAQRVFKSTRILAVPSNKFAHVIDIKPSEKLIAHRLVITKNFKFHKCSKCGHVWQLTKSVTDPLISLPTSSEVFIEEIPINTQQGPRIVKYLSAICPGCSYHDCNEVMKQDKKIKVFSAEKHFTDYILGIKDGPIEHIKENDE